MPSRGLDVDQGILCIDPSDRLVWAHWETASSAFDPRTGETHLLSILPAEVLHLLEGAPRRFCGLCDDLARLCETDNSPEWQAKLRDIIADLMQLEIVDHRVDAA